MLQLNQEDVFIEHIKSTKCKNQKFNLLCMKTLTMSHSTHIYKEKEKKSR